MKKVQSINYGEWFVVVLLEFGILILINLRCAFLLALDSNDRGEALTSRAVFPASISSCGIDGGC